MKIFQRPARVLKLLYKAKILMPTIKVNNFLQVLNLGVPLLLFNLS